MDPDNATRAAGIPGTCPPLATRVIREIDRRAIEELGLPGCVLMENAGRAATAGLLAAAPAAAGRASDATPVVILCGGGNNGGDGHVIARHLAIAGVPTSTWSVRALEELAPDAQLNARVNRALGLPQRFGSVAARAAAELDRTPIIVDALLGTGQSGELREPYASLVERANQSPAWRAAIDVPSGFEADSGRKGKVCFRANWTATFVAPKLGFELPDARLALGTVEVFDIGVPASFVERVVREFG